MSRHRYTKDMLEPIVQRCLSLAQVLKELNLKPTGGNYRNISTRIRVFGISTEHFRGMGWSRGETAQTHPTVARIANTKRLPDAKVFVENSPVYNGPRLIRRLRRLGWHCKCNEWGRIRWRGQELTLHLHHKNGIHNDNRFENLQLLCPNCHSLTTTYAGRNRKRGKAR
jgi:5-methylcytosine-specific restriction endonuclease McrA